jgi:hypothetical protein
MHIPEIVSIAFKLINFAALITLGIYLFKRFALPDIQLQISKKQQKQADLFLQNQLLKEQAKAMDFTIAEQQSVSRGLLQKIDLWKSLIAHHNLEQDKEKKARYLSLAQKATTQQSYIALKHVEKKALLPALEQARKDLIHDYQAMPLGQSFIANVIEKIEKSSV